MKAVWFEKKGPAREVLNAGELPDPQAAAGQVRVRMHVSGVNPSDTKTRGGFRGQRVVDADAGRQRRGTRQEGAAFLCGGD